MLANRGRRLDSSTVRIELANFQGSLIKARQPAFLLLSLRFPQCELLVESNPFLRQGSPEGLEDQYIPIPSCLIGHLRNSLQKCLWAGSLGGPAGGLSCLMAYYTAEQLGVLEPSIQVTHMKSTYIFTSHGHQSCHFGGFL